MKPQELFAQFENLGDSCEFGLVQRHYDVEPLSLLRWAGVPLAGLITAFIHDFKDLFRYENLAGRPHSMVLDTKYKFLFFSSLVWHAGADARGDLTQTPEQTQAIYRKESARILFLLNKFREDLASRRRIYVYKSIHGLSTSDMLRLKAALDLNGPQRLLCVVPSNPATLHGQVIPLASGLKLAALDRMAPYDDQENADFEGWLTICRGAVAGEWDQNAHLPPPTNDADPIESEKLAYTETDVILDDAHVATSVYRTLYRTLLLREADETGLASNVADAVSHRRTLEYAVNRILVSEEYTERFHVRRSA